MTGQPAPEIGLQQPTLGSVRQLRAQVGYRSRPDGAAYQQYLLDLPVDENASPLEEAEVLAALAPALYAGADAPRHYSLHQHRSHTTWGLAPSALEIGLLVTTEAANPDLTRATDEAVIHAFRDLMVLIGGQGTDPLSREAALSRARRHAATAFKVDPESLWLSTEEHRPREGSWNIVLRTNHGEQYDVCVGFVDGYVDSARVGHARLIEVSDSLGSE